MLTLKQAALVLAKIATHHGNAPIDQLTLESFHEELLATATIDECMHAVRDWYAADHTGRWMRAGDVNHLILQHRAASKPSEAQIARECERLGITGEDDAWMYRRRRMLGDTPQQAQTNLTVGRPRQQVNHPTHQTSQTDRLADTPLTTILTTEATR